MADALPLFRELIARNDAAMRAADIPEVMRHWEEAHHLALRLNRGDPAILADDDSPGYALMRATAAEPGAFPLWGQRGDFRITMNGMQARIEMDGMFGIGMSFGIVPGFSTHAVDYSLPFLSETGYRSFLGIHAELVAGIAPEAFARQVVSSLVSDSLKGRLVPIRREHQHVPHTARAS